MRRSTPAIHIASILALSAGCLSQAYAETVNYKADLTPQQEVPANTSKGLGTAAITYDTASKKLAWSISYLGLTGPATVAHFHGPAEAGKNAGVVLPIANPATPMEGSATLTDAQAADLAAEKMYINVHTAENKGGEIRGQVVKGK